MTYDVSLEMINPSHSLTPTNTTSEHTLLPYWQILTYHAVVISRQAKACVMPWKPM